MSTQKDIATPSSHTIIWDCETGPLPASYLDMIAPTFEAQSNLVDPVKIEASIAKKKAEWMDRAALSPLTGRILAIGYRDLDGKFACIDGGGDESKLLQEWCDLVSLYKNENFVGFNTHLFDIPYLVKRCWRYGIRPFIRPGTNLRYAENWIDLRDVWQMGDRQAEGSLDAISKFLGVGAKNGEGKNFHLLWQSDRDAALKYLENDITLAYAVGQKLGVII